MFEGVTIKELLEGYGVYKQLIDAKLLIVKKDNNGIEYILLDGDESIRYLEKQNLELKNKVEEHDKNLTLEVQYSNKLSLKLIEYTKYKMKINEINKMCVEEMSYTGNRGMRFAKPLAYDIINIIEKNI